MALSFANKVTVARIVTVPVFVVTVLYYSPERVFLGRIAFGLFLLAVITDVIDGYIARTRHQKTKAGAILDPLADKILLISAFVCLFRMRDMFGPVQFPLWLVLTIISRDVILLMGSMIIYLVHGDLKISPSRWGKASTFFQIICIIGIFLQWPYSFVLWGITAVLTLISGLGYIRNGIKVLNAPSAGQSV